MTKLSMTLAIATLTVSLAPTAQAYSVEPDVSVTPVSVVDQINVLIGAADTAHEGTCELGVTPILANALGISLPQDGQGDDHALALAACEPN